LLFPFEKIVPAPVPSVKKAANTVMSERPVVVGPTLISKFAACPRFRYVS